MHHISFMHSSADGHSGCVHVLTIVNSATMNIRVHVYLLELRFSLDICPGEGFLGYMVVLFLVF